MTPDDLDEASFFTACRTVAEFLERRHDAQLSFSQDNDGRLILHVRGAESITWGAHDPGGMRKPTASFYFQTRRRL